jgi:hypothetical protein
MYRVIDASHAEPRALKPAPRRVKKPPGAALVPPGARLVKRICLVLPALPRRARLGPLDASVAETCRGAGVPAVRRR